MSDHQVNIADWTLESWLAVKGATSSKDENVFQYLKIIFIFIVFLTINLIIMINVRNGLDGEGGSNCDGPRPSKYAQFPF